MCWTTPASIAWQLSTTAALLVGWSARFLTRVDRELYLPKEWETDAARRAEAHVPEQVGFHLGHRPAASTTARTRVQRLHFLCGPAGSTIEAARVPYRTVE